MKNSHYGVVKIENLDSVLGDELTVIAINEFGCSGSQNNEIIVNDIENTSIIPDEILTMSGEFTEDQSDLVNNLFFSDGPQDFIFFFEGDLQIINKNANLFIEFIKENLNIDATLEILENQEWRDTYKAFFTHAIVDDALVVLPDWNASNKDFNSFQRKLLINPGMGFGTGGHETTRLCLKFLNQLENVPKVLDLGCGSGVLGNFCELYLSSKVDYVDVDEDALQNCLQNIELNKLSSHQNVYLRSKYEINYKYDLVIANILKPVLELESDLIYNSLSSSGMILFSGLLKDQYIDLINFYEKKFQVNFKYDVFEENGWVAVLITEILKEEI